MNVVCTSFKSPSVEKELVPNIRRFSNVEQAKDIYLRCAFVCLLSAMKNGEADRAIFVTDTALNAQWNSVFCKENIEVFIVESTDRFVVDAQAEWNITQYKYEALCSVCSKLDPTDNLLFLDSDTVTVGNLADIFSEIADGSFMLYDTRHSYSHPARKRIRENYMKLFGEGNPVHWGGEFIAGTVKQVTAFLSECCDVIDRMKNTQGLQNVADEHVTSIAVARLNEVRIRNASAYIYRFWTGDPYIVSTNYYFDRVAIWHLPAEKVSGIREVYQYYKKHAVLPNVDFIARVSRMPAIHAPLMLRIRRRLSKLHH